MGAYSDCKKCQRHISRYSIDRTTLVNGIDVVKEYQVKFCWGCGYFTIYPNQLDEFTSAILNNGMLIIELIDRKKLKPIL